MTEEILKIVEERRQYKNRNITKYRECHAEYEERLDAKKRQLSEKCKTIEQCERKYVYHNMHKKIKEMTFSKR